MKIVRKNKEKQTINSLSLDYGDVFEHSGYIWIICEMGELDNIKGSQCIKDCLQENLVICTRLEDGHIAIFNTVIDPVNPVLTTVLVEDK